MKNHARGKAAPTDLCSGTPDHSVERLARAVAQSGMDSVAVTADGSIGFFDACRGILSKFANFEEAIEFLSGTIAQRNAIYKRMEARREAEAIQAQIEQLYHKRAAVLQEAAR